MTDLHKIKRVKYLVSLFFKLFYSGIAKLIANGSISTTT